MTATGTSLFLPGTYCFLFSIFPFLDEQKPSIEDAAKSEEHKNGFLPKDTDADDVSSKSSATVTTTSNTMNTEQKLINTDESINEVVSTSVVDATSAPATSAVEKIDVIEKAVTDIKAQSSSPMDVEITEDSTADVEMVDVASKAPIKVTEETNNYESSATITNSQSEQKIDDIEKNISNLFNGEENVVSDEADSASNNGPNSSVKDVSAKIDSSSSSSVAVENGEKCPKQQEEVAKPLDDVIKDTVSDSSDLVSILTDDNPQTAAKISSTSSSMADGKEASNDTISSAENLSLAGITNTPSSSTGQRKFNKPENVSKISEATIDIEQGLGDKSTRQEIVSSHSSATNELSDISSAAVTGE